MKKYNLKNIAGLSLVEMLIGIVITSMMIMAIITSYNVVNKSYSQVTDRAKISRSGRDIVEMMMRDIRMAGFRYILGTNTLDFPTRSYLEFKGGDTTIFESHDPIIIEKNVLGFSVDGTADPESKHEDEDVCCDRIHIVYDDFNQNDVNQPYKRYKITYFAMKSPNDDDTHYGIYKSKESWIQPIGQDTGAWTADPTICSECYSAELIRNHLTDMEFNAFDKQGKIINPPPNPDDPDTRGDLYNIKIVDVRLTFRSKREFFRSEAPDDKPRIVKGLGDRTREFFDKFLRDSVVVTVYTRNIGAGS